MFRVELQIADTQVSMSLRMILNWLHSKKKWNGSSFSQQLQKGVFNYGRDGDVKSVVWYNRFVRDNFLESIVFWVGRYKNLIEW